MTTSAFENFIFYTSFSSIEYLTIMLLVISVFNIEFKFYKRETVIIAITSSIITYGLVMFNITKIVPVPIILIPYVSLLIKYFFKKSMLYAVAITSSGFVFYGLLQILIVLLSIAFEVLTVNELEMSFSFKSYLLQSACSVIGLLIASYVRVYNTGFGFSLNGKKKYLLITSATPLVSAVLCVVTFILVSNFTSLLFLLFFLIVSVFSTVVILYFSAKRDDVEFS